MIILWFSSSHHFDASYQWFCKYFVFRNHKICLQIENFQVAAADVQQSAQPFATMYRPSCNAMFAHMYISMCAFLAVEKYLQIHNKGLFAENRNIVPLHLQLARVLQLACECVCVFEDAVVRASSQHLLTIY